MPPAARASDREGCLCRGARREDQARVPRVVPRARRGRGRAAGRRGAAPRAREGSREEKIELAYLIVGPEGDFTPRELEALVEAGAVPVGLGGNRLRVETAAEALLAVAGAMLG